MVGAGVIDTACGENSDVTPFEELLTLFAGVSKVDFGLLPNESVAGF